MKTATAFLFFILSTNLGFSQTEIAPAPNVELPSVEKYEYHDTGFTCGGDPEASFPGGGQKLKQYVLDHFPIHKIEMENLQNGYFRVYLSFMVCQDGTIENVKIARGINKEIDSLCVQFIENMPNWMPAQDKNRPIDFPVNFPINFNL